MNLELRQALDEIARRIRQFRLWSSLACCWAAWALVGAIARRFIGRTESAAVLGGTSLLILVGLIVVSAAVCVALALRSARNQKLVAQRIESRYPELGTGLLAAVEQDQSRSGELGYLQSVVIREALVHRHLHQWNRIVPRWTLTTAKVLHAATFACLLIVAFSFTSDARTRHAELVEAAAATRAEGLTVEPGHAELELGTPLLVVARFGSTVPPDATLVTESANGDVSRRPMTRHLEDPLFAGRVESLSGDLKYHVKYDGRSSETFQITTFEYPRVVRTDADLTFPGYTSLSPKTVEDVRHITAVEGTNVVLRMRLNKQVQTANLVDDLGTIELAPAGDASDVYTATLKLDQSRKLTVQLVDAKGRKNKIATQLSLNVIPNRPPAVVAAQPAHDVRVSPIEELSVKAKVNDDFGVVRHGVTFALAGQPTQEVVLNEAPAQETRFEASHLLDFEAFQTSPDELVTYYFWAEDIGPDGEPRRTSGDMYFAEVRPFEEIFRQGEQQAAQQQNQQQQQGANSNGEKAMELAEMQKQIINATWKVVRRETISKVTPQLGEDSRLIAETQNAAIEQATALAEQIESPESQEDLNRAIRLMKEATTALEQAASANAAAPLETALAAEQAAYQALLKLRDREFNVTQNQSQQQSARGAAAGSPSQQQLQQLELKNDENRYEERSAASDDAATPEDEAQAELRQVLSRLNELAQRQNDLNERLKEMQAALEAAEDEQTKEELARQLKRLREQQQEILRDADELRERMEQEQNRERMAEARQAVEESREHVRQASEALEQQQLSQALTEGTRAGRQFEETGEQLRSESSRQLAEQMQEMRESARQLTEEQDRLSKALEALAEEPSRSLRQGEERETIREGLAEQQTRLAELDQRLRDTVQQVEEDEPLVAEKLFEAVRQAESQAIPNALDAAQQLTELGVAAEAGKASRHAGEALDQLRQDVEQAAESVLGDETAALRRARGELDELSEEIDREIDPQAGSRKGYEERTGSAKNDEEQDGGQPASQNDSGESNPRSRDQTSEDATDEARTPSERREGPERRPGASNQENPADDGQPGSGEPQQSTDRQRGQSSGRPGEQPEQGGAETGRGKPQPGESPSPGPRGEGNGSPRPQGQSGSNSPGGLDQLLEGLGTGSPGGPITGSGFREWSDRMRDVEELVNDPDLRAEAARIRDRVRGSREDFVRHSKEPDPKELQEMVAEPIRELRKRVAEEIRRRENPDALVPIDRDPVPPAFAEGVRRYYERLGSGR